MAIFLLILQVLEAIPTLITIIKDIIALIHKQPAVQQVELMGDLREILHARKDGSDSETALQSQLENFKQHLVEKYG